MKSIIVYSSLTGNTKMIAEAIHKVTPESEIYKIEDAPDPIGYDLIALGYWVDKGLPDMLSIQYLEKISNTNIILFGTLGADPNSDHAKKCAIKAEELINNEAKNNHVLGTYLCQGKIDPAITAKMVEYLGEKYLTPEKEARLKEASKHPDENDCRKAGEIFTTFLNQLQR